jgi:Radical SAM superfamily
MTVDCILFYGNHMIPMSKYAGTFRIATELRNAGYTVQCIDVTAYEGHWDELVKTIKLFVGKNTLWVGISTTFLHHIFRYPFFRSVNAYNKRFSKNKTKQDMGLISFVNTVKSINPKVKFIAGGARQFMLEKYGFKTFIKNNDKEIIEFTNYCAGTSKQIPVSFLGSTIEGSEFENFTNSQNIFTKNDIVETTDTLPIEVSRGCIFKCKFCSFPLNGKQKGEWIKKSNTLYDELVKNYELHGTTDYSFSDDTYNDSPEKVKRLYDDVYSKLPFKLNFTTYIRLDLMIRFPDTVAYLKESGLKSAAFGIETINHESGKAIGKGLNPLEQFQFIEEIKKNEFKDILTYSGFILGLPKDRPDEAERLEEFLFSEKNKLDDFISAPLYISPPKFDPVSKKYFSEFDLEYEKYGYTVYEEIEKSVYTDLRWTNDRIGTTFDQVYQHSKRLNERAFNSSKFKCGGFGYAWYRSLGILSDDLTSLSRFEIYKKYDIPQLLKNKKEKYRSLILNTTV